MRVFIYCIYFIVIGISHLVHASDNNTLPALPTLDLPSSSVSKKDPLPALPSLEAPSPEIPKNDVPDAKNQVTKPSTEREAEDSKGESTSTESSTAQPKEFIDTGNFVLPKIENKSPETNLTLPSIPSISSVDKSSETKNAEDIALPSNKSDAGATLDSLPPIGENIPEPSIPDKSSAPEVNANVTATQVISGSPDGVTNNNGVLPKNSNVETNNISAPPPVNSSLQPSTETHTNNIDSNTKQPEKVSDVAPTPVEIAPRTSRGGQSPNDAIAGNVNNRNRRGGGEDDTKEKDEDEDRQAFINDESTMLLLEDDDIVLGKLTTKAYLDSLHCKDYINLFWKTYVSGMDQKQSHITDSFIRKYEFSHKGMDASVLSGREAKRLAFEAVRRDNLEDLRILVDNYPILQSYNKNGNNMLMMAIEFDNIPMSKFLLIRGSDLFSVNSEGDNIFSISRESSNPAMERIINDAMFLGRVK